MMTVKAIDANTANDPTSGATHVCPIWVGYLLASPLRRLVHNPTAILRGHVQAGMTVLDLGCAMGYFSIPMARMVGEAGRVICVDVQEPMLRKLERRAESAGVRSRIEPRLVVAESLPLDDLAGSVGFALAFAVMHEIPDQARALAEVAAALSPGGRLLISEPKGHVSAADFAATLDRERAAGLELRERPRHAGGHAALLSKA